MTALLSPPPKIQFFDDNGDPLTGGKVYTYEAGTSNPKTAWKDEAATQAHTNPIILNSRGEPAAGPLFLEGSYKINVTDSADVQITGYPVDNITAYGLLDWSGLTASIADLNSTTTTTIVKTSDYTTVLTERGKTILANATSAKVTITLLSAITAKNGYRITIKKTDVTTNIVEVATTGAQTIDTNDKFELRDVNDYIEVISDGSNWKLVSGQIRGSTIAISATQANDFEDHGRTYITDASGGAVTINLLSAGVVGRGYEITVKKSDSSTNAVTLDADGAETIDGEATFALTEQYGVVTIKADGSNWHIISDIVSSGNVNLPKGYISGFQTANNVGNPTTHIDIGIGSARDFADTQDINLKTLITKRFDLNWAEGTNNGGYATGATRAVDTWAHVFVIAKPDGTTDAGFDTSTTATNLLADATGYTKYRRVATIKSTSGSSTLVLAYWQYGDEFVWNAMVSDYGGSGVAVSTPISVTLATAPKDINVLANIHVLLENQTQIGELNIYLDDQAAPVQNAVTSLFSIDSTIGAPLLYGAANVRVITKNQKIKYRVDPINPPSCTAIVVQMATKGWKDFRGKDGGI
jgi:hypothetical protein